jgi:hypothetical protein
MYGTCKKLLSNSDETLILPMQKMSINEVDSNIFVLSSNMEKLCRSGAVNATSGRCKGQPLKSLNKVNQIVLLTLNYRGRCARLTLIARHLIQTRTLSASVEGRRREINIATSKQAIQNGLLLSFL